ncbi:hypothetical protein HCG60_05335 [Ligilactobacillus murinus]|uniref:hypothetical protein n=1 Tax=Ligilactobacillus murinus TaxID=1622 RepID=UPI001C8CA688|nr:hypothetical protein [Ligilactobacillus murinus]MBX9012451.1 hypothetical protein [Ligilactobacillus murinus]
MNRVKNIKINSVVLLLFLVITISMIYPLAATGRIAAQVDWLFHAARVEQIYRNLSEGSLFTYIATSTFQSTGVGSFLFYPVIFIYPWAWLRFITTPVVAYYVWVGLFMFVTFVISYFSMLSFSKGKYLRSFIFALLYTLAPYRLYLGPASFVIGEYIASTFIPLAFLGFYHIICGDKRKWYWLTIGMTLLAYSHMLSILLISEIFTVLLLVALFTGKFDLKRSKYLLISAIATVILALPVIIPLLTDYFGKGITATYPGVGMIQNLGEVFTTSLSNTATSSSIGIVLLLVLLSGWRWIKQDSLELPLYILAICLTLISTAIFPWKSFNDSFLALLQLPYRYLIYVVLLTAILGSRIVVELLTKYGVLKTNWRRAMTILALLLVSLISYYGSISNLSDRLANTAKNKETIIKPLKADEQAILYAGILTNKNYQAQFDYWAQTGEVDYFPTKTLKKNHFLEYIIMDWDKAYRTNKDVYSIISGVTRINGQEMHIKPYASANALQYQVELARKSKIDLPVVHYAHTVVTVDGKPVAYQNSKRNTVQLDLEKGKHTVVVGYVPSKVFFIGTKIALIGWGLLLIWIICQTCYFKRKN